MSQYLLMEQEADELLRRQKDIIETAKSEKRDMTSGERDSFFQMQGAAQALEANARALRDAELEDLKKVPAAVIPTDTDDRSEFLAYLRTGTAPRASVTTTDANGGYIVPEPLQKGLIDKIRTRNPFFANATVFQMTGDVVINLPRKYTHGATAVAAEAAARSEQTAPTFSSVALRAFDHYTDQRATQTWIDSVAGSEEMLLGWIYDDLFEAAEKLMVNGSGGTQESYGLFSNTSASGYTQKYVATEGTVANSDLFQCYFALNSKYRGAAKWYMNTAVLSALSTLAHPAAADTPLVTMQGDTAYIFGKPVVEMESASTTASGETWPIAFADLANAYAIGVHRDLSILRDPYSAAPYVRYYGLLRAGGAPWDRQAAILLKSDTA